MRIFDAYLNVEKRNAELSSTQHPFTLAVSDVLAPSVTRQLA